MLELLLPNYLIMSEQVPSKWGIQKSIEKMADNLTIPVINSSSPLASQGPTAVDTPYQVSFGPDQGAVTDDVYLLANWDVVFTKAGNHAIRLRAELWRVNTGGTVVMLFRTTFNGVQIWNTTTQKLESKNVLISLDAYVPALVGAGTLRFEIMRDSSGTNDGELQQSIPVDPTWGPSATANIQIYNLNQVT